MTAAVVVGLVFGAGAWLAYSGLRPSPVPLATALARLGQPTTTARRESGGLDARIGSRLRRIGAVERAVSMLRADLALLGRDPDEQIAQMAAAVLLGLVWAPAVAGAAAVVGMRLPLLVPAWAALLGGALGAAVPYRKVREQAARSRAAFGHALSAYCDVVGMAMSAGRESYAAAFDAAAAGQGPAFAQIRDALQIGFMAGEKPWDSLRRLGEEIGVEDLVELGAALALAGDEGAAVRETVASKSRSIRGRLVADAERRAGATTERMALPGVVLLLGFIGFLTFPAVFLIVEQSH